MADHIICNQSFHQKMFEQYQFLFRYFVDLLLMTETEIDIHHLCSIPRYGPHTYNFKQTMESEINMLFLKIFVDSLQKKHVEFVAHCFCCGVNVPQLVPSNTNNLCVVFVTV